MGRKSSHRLGTNILPVFFFFKIKKEKKESLRCGFIAIACDNNEWYTIHTTRVLVRLSLWTQYISWNATIQNSNYSTNSKYHAKQSDNFYWLPSSHTRNGSWTWDQGWNHVQTEGGCAPPPLPPQFLKILNSKYIFEILENISVGAKTWAFALGLKSHSLIIMRPRRRKHGKRPRNR